MNLHQHKRYSAFMMICFLILFSCEKETFSILPDLPQEVRYLSIAGNSSSNTLIANGVNQIYFKVTAYDSDHKKITNLNSVTLSKIKIEINGANELSPPYVFTTTQAGTYTFNIKGLLAEADLSGPINITAMNDPIYDEVNLPVIFHYVAPWVTEVERKNLQTQLSKNLQEVNQAFTNSLGSKDPNAVNPNIKFTLAENDPEGNPLLIKGYHEIYSTNKSFGDYANSTNDQLAWDGNFWNPKKYINVWIVPLDDNFSWAYFPVLSPSSATFPNRTYGVVLNQKHIYEPMVLAHELGHMFNLRHVFEDSCTDPDFCNDTWAYKRKFNDTETQWYLTRKTCDEVAFVANNYMDYYPSQNTTFSLEQVKRMQNTLDDCPFLPTEKNMLNGKMTSVPYSNLTMKREKDIPHRVI